MATSELFLRNKYGFFDKESHEFIITRCDTPRPWANYITNGKLSGIVTNSGGGFSFFISPRVNRISRWRYNSLPWDRPGRYIFIRDRHSGEYWSPTWQPTETQLTSYSCRHGFNYSTISGEYSDIRSSVTYFVSPVDNIELWWVTLKNLGKETRLFDIYSYLELCLGHALVDLINQPNDQHFNEIWYDAENQILHGTKRYWVAFNQATVKQANYAWGHKIFMASNLKALGFDGSKDVFMGRWRSEANPEAIEKGTSFNTQITAGDAIFAIRYDLTLQPGAEVSFPVINGIVTKETPPEKVIEIVSVYRDNTKVEEQFNLLLEQRKAYFQGLQVSLPDPVTDMMINYFNQYQVKTTFQFSRDASLYHGGLLFGRGYRDSAQDSLGPLMTRQDWVRDRLCEMTKMQFQDGTAYHLYYPVTGGGERTQHMDNPLWLPFLAIAYLRETAEMSLLDEEFEFVDGGKATLLDHMKRSIDYVLQNLSPRNLVLFKGGDWNDTLDFCGRKGKGESLWMTMFLSFIIKEFIELLDYIGNKEMHSYYTQWHHTLGTQSMNMRGMASGTSVGQTTSDKLSARTVPTKAKSSSIPRVGR